MKITLPPPFPPVQLISCDYFFSKLKANNSFDLKHLFLAKKLQINWNWKGQ